MALAYLQGLETAWEGMAASEGSGLRLDVATPSSAARAALGASRYNARPMARLAACLALAALLGGGFAYRLAAVAEKQYPAGDGTQYHKLSQELRRAGRFALGPPPALLVHGRSPGYPLFLAYVAVRQFPVTLAEHLRRATRWNALLDVLSAAFVFLILYERRLGASAGLIAAFGVLTCPALLVLSAYGLSDSLATCLTLLAVLLAVHAMRSSRLTLWAALAGIAIGFAQLVRLDGVIIAPAVAVALLLAAAPLRRRLLAVGVCALTAALTFLPWPVRNVLRFGTPALTGGWVARDGRTLPDEVMTWMRSYGTGAPGESFIILRFALHGSVDRRTVVLPAMVDSEAERVRVQQAFERYNQERFSDPVIGEFGGIARERRLRHPLRTYVLLPLKRLRWLWSPLPPGDFPMESRLLDLPARRDGFGDRDRHVFLLAGLGLFALFAWRRLQGGRATAVVLLTAIVARSLLHAYVHPFPLQRYVVEVLPLVIALAAVGLATPVWVLHAHVAARSRRPSPADEPNAA